ncbi:hypothetical protein A1356_15485 [Methylomonas koyamae]|uniref:Peptidase A2 domain-containing protein n=1 Tax=Methylomonas koyamae TaxID=702114 RepID=A0AA91I5E7_9GAMM|nr:hypothetical protein A1356_15485 [Methylomonas koyamae]
MGIQDRDYYWEKHRQASQNASRGPIDDLVGRPISRRRPANSSKPRGVRFLIYPTLALVVLWYGADRILKDRQVGMQPAPVATIIQSTPPAQVTIAPAPTQQRSAQSQTGGAILTADRNGHFRGTVVINGTLMPFMIDTGATLTVIPEKWAPAAKLPLGRVIQANTAGGNVAERETRIETLQLGNALIQNLNAHTNPYLNEVLIGMNTLKLFKMVQEGNRLTLTTIGMPASQSPAAKPMATLPGAAVAVAASDTEQPIKKPSVIKKSVICDANKVCKTVYSDH